MPSLFRFLILILFLALLVFGGMIALTVFVTPQNQEVTMKLPARTLFDDAN